MLFSEHNFRVVASAAASSTESGRTPAFFYASFQGREFRADMSAVQSEIEEILATVEPGVEVLLAETLPNGTLRVFIDHPDGVTLGLCERVTSNLSDLRERYSLEVSSPGAERPLTKPNHFRRYLGRRARVRTREPRLVSATTTGSVSEHRAKSFTGELVGVTDSEITLAADGGIIAIPYSEIRRSNLVEE
jgi:ribosome maturation factor RimP